MMTGNRENVLGVIISWDTKLLFIKDIYFVM